MTNKEQNFEHIFFNKKNCTRYWYRYIAAKTLWSDFLRCKLIWNWTYHRSRLKFHLQLCCTSIKTKPSYSINIYHVNLRGFQTIKNFNLWIKMDESNETMVLNDTVVNGAKDPRYLATKYLMFKIGKVYQLFYQLLFFSLIFGGHKSFSWCH